MYLIIVYVLQQHKAIKMQYQGWTLQKAPVHCSATTAPAELAGSNFVLPTKYSVMTRQNADNGADDIYITPAVVWTVISVVSVHCREEGCIGFYIPQKPRDFPRPERCPEGFVLGTTQGPREISRLEGMYNPMHPSLMLCTDTTLIINSSL